MTDQSQRNAVNWFEIPVRDIDRAQRFYEVVLAAPSRCPATWAALRTSPTPTATASAFTRWRSIARIRRLSAL